MAFLMRGVAALADCSGFGASGRKETQGLLRAVASTEIRPGRTDLGALIERLKTFAIPPSEVENALGHFNHTGVIEQTRKLTAFREAKGAGRIGVLRRRFDVARHDIRHDVEEWI